MVIKTGPMNSIRRRSGRVVENAKETKITRREEERNVDILSEAKLKAEIMGSIYSPPLNGVVHGLRALSGVLRSLAGRFLFYT